jgi:hypothetical protein
MSKQSSFSVKSSHRLVNPTPEPEPEPYPSTNYYYGEKVKQPVTKGWTNSDSDRKEGSNKGMVIRTTNTSVEDYY